MKRIVAILTIAPNMAHGRAPVRAPEASFLTR
jgi:hypothetical protein